jgi:GAF domain-containing protein
MAADPVPGLDLPPAAEPAAVPPDWRAGALGDLHDLLVSAVPVEHLLEAVAARAAARAGVGCSAAITVRIGDTSAVAAATDERSAACDRAEQQAGAGPCVDASRTQVRIVLPDVSAEDDRWARWRAWHEATVAAGFRSAAALPAARSDGERIELAINLYDTATGGWSEDVLADVGRFAEDAARAVVVASVLQEQSRANEDLRLAMASRTVIDQALGVVMAQNRCGPEEAFAILRRASQSRNQKMRDLAASIVASVSGVAPHSPHEFRERPRG